MSTTGHRALSPDLAAHAVPAGAEDALATSLHEATEHVGVWEAGPGVAEDVEDDEVFLVLAGEGRVTFEDDSTIDLRPGVLVRLRSGDRTRWEITRRLRKFYVS